jgi:hypothetical protein
MIQRFDHEDVERLNALRRRAAGSWLRAEVLDAPPGWTVSRADAAQVLAPFEALKLKPGFKLAAFQYREGDDGNGLVLALPAEASEEAVVAGGSIHPPEGAPADLMDAIEGDGTPWGYLCASVFAREAREFGALGHGVRWLDAHLLSAAAWDPDRQPVPTFSNERVVLARGDWAWNETPETFDPTVTLEDGGVVEVLFHTYRGREEGRITQYLDGYPPRRYAFVTRETPLATLS